METLLIIGFVTSPVILSLLLGCCYELAGQIID